VNPKKLEDFALAHFHNKQSLMPEARHIPEILRGKKVTYGMAQTGVVRKKNKTLNDVLVRGLHISEVDSEKQMNLISQA